VDLSAAVAFANQAGKGQAAGVLANGGEGGTGEVADSFQGEAPVLMENQQDPETPMVCGPLEDIRQLADFGVSHKGLNRRFGKRMRSDPKK